MQNHTYTIIHASIIHDKHTCIIHQKTIENCLGNKKLSFVEREELKCAEVELWLGNIDMLADDGKA